MATSEVVVVQEQQTPTRVHIRWMIVRDIPEVLDIEQKSFKKPWEKVDFFDQLRKRDCMGMVAEVGEKVVGFMVYEFAKDHFRLINIAVHPDYRGKGIGEQLILKLQGKLGSNGRTHIVALVPESCLKVESFFKKYGITIHPTENKGQMIYKPVFAAMTKKDTDEAQVIEDELLRDHGREPRDIGAMIANSSRYGIVARDKSSGVLLGYVLYERDHKGIALNGEFGVIVGTGYRRHGIGRKLVEELVGQKLPITLYSVCLTCEDQVDFLKAVGVPIPKLERFVNVEWKPDYQTA